MKIYKINEIPYKKILGRNIKSAGSNETLNLFWGASAIEVKVKANEVWAELSSDFDNLEIWVAVEVNGFQISRFMLSKEKRLCCLARNLNPEKENLISLIKDTQPMPDDVKHALYVHSIGLNDDGKFCPVNPRKMKIEFIGDSITSGEGLAGVWDENEWIPQWFCASKTYAMQVSKALNADWTVMSQCGWGIKWAWNGDRNCALPPHYENVCSIMKGDFENQLGVNEKYDFGNGSDFVILNLGTNDNNAFTQPAWSDSNGKVYELHVDSNGRAVDEDGKIISDEVKGFLSVIRKHNPKAKIIWTWGMMTLHAIPDFILQGVQEYKNETNDSCVYTLELDSMDIIEKTNEDKGSRGHPGAVTHKTAAGKIIDFIQRL